MIRTRDFLLYLLVLVFILVGISVTIATDRDYSAVNDRDQIALKTQAGSEELGANTIGEIDRQQKLADLRAKLARGEGTIIQGAPVFTSVDTPTSTDEPVAFSDINPDAVVDQSSRSQQWCAAMLPSATATNWPQQSVTLSAEGDVRIATGLISKEVSNGSTTDLVTVTQSLIELPIVPERTFASNCLDSEFVGVALDGSLIKNSDTWRFRNYTSDTLVGYARDGHPIYGPGANETLLDMCGGYDTGSGYRYHLRDNDLFILGCYAAPPQPFLD